ncbi:plasmid mobilization relaxosome protein MobC [uncultured Gemmiger sp.]
MPRNNLNQIARIANATGRVFQAQMDEIPHLMLTAWQPVRYSL